MDGVRVTPLKCISQPKGDLFHGLKASEECFTSFGEAYFTTVIAGEIKGWKKHTRMRLNLMVPVGEVDFYVHDERTGVTEKYTSCADSFCRICVEPGLWVAFTSEKKGTNLILNIASIEHDPDEAVNKNIDLIPLR
ncbi:MAG: dTDP-4-dehydrorhamnose 3,5-epimerase [Candidatus Latescibacterota bacterium]|jgi:dTDP-4-dehydrorhamnose 3,5-epimerase